jgi:hypothetical protein
MMQFFLTMPINRMMPTIATRSDPCERPSATAARRGRPRVGWNYWGLTRSQKGFDHTLICIESFVRQYGIGLNLRQNRVGTFKIMRLTTS